MVSSIVNRWNQKKASPTFSWWESNSEDLDVDDFLYRVKEDLKGGKGYIARCKVASGYFRPLSGPLMSPKIGVYADRLEQRASDVEKVLALESSSIPLAKKFDSDWEKLLGEIAKGRKLTHGLIEEVQDLPSFNALDKLAQECGEITYKIYVEETEGSELHIIWSLDEYIGGASGLYPKLEKLSSESVWIEDDFQGARNIYGYIKRMLDLDIIKETIDELG
jgi:hypothetical protein